MGEKQFESDLQKLVKYYRLRGDMIKFKNQATNQMKDIQRRSKDTGFEDKVKFLLSEVTDCPEKFKKAAERYEKEMVRLVEDMSA